MAFNETMPFLFFILGKKGTTHLFQTLALDSCNVGELAWNRARSDSTGELMKRGLGFRYDPMV